MRYLIKLCLAEFSLSNKNCTESHRGVHGTYADNAIMEKMQLKIL